MPVERTNGTQGQRFHRKNLEPPPGLLSDALDAKGLEHQHHIVLIFCFEKDDASFRTYLVSTSRGSCRTAFANRVLLLSSRHTHVARGLLAMHAIPKGPHGCGSRAGKHDVLQKPGQFL
jgi:hypothetical protein